MTKKESRKQFKEFWNAMADGTLASISSAVCRLILKSDEWEKASTLLGYLSFGKEISLDLLIQESLSAGKIVAVPLIESRTEMTFRKLSRWTPEGFSLNRWGIREPERDRPPVIPGEKCLILVPGLGFSTDGRRMGRGGGYYDRYLSAADLSGSHLMGICCEAGLSEEIPTDPHDIPVHSICTEKRLISP